MSILVVNEGHLQHVDVGHVVRCGIRDSSAVADDIRDVVGGGVRRGTQGTGSRAGWSSARTRDKPAGARVTKK